ncbi:MAG: phosphatidate cytidylyltransferase [Flavobacteriaceae bacterium]|nr:phosphatidate cytidylyltransferase [Flavobacteriaceae bacterium]
MNNLLERSISGLVFVVLFIGAILYSKESYILLISIFGLVSIWEFSKIIQLKNSIPYILFGAFIAAPFFDFDIETSMPILLFVALTGSIQMIFHLYSKRTNYPSTILQRLDTSIRYIVFSFGLLILLPIKEGVYQESIILSLVLFIWTNDSFAYLVGKNFGKRKLFEKISPKKTIEGFIGGVVFTVIVGIVISYYFDILSMEQWIVLSLMTSILGTIGDLIESKFKRQANIKDSGKIMPGHGGLLDRLDSLLFVAPFVYLYIHYLI